MRSTTLNGTARLCVPAKRAAETSGGRTSFSISSISSRNNEDLNSRSVSVNSTISSCVGAENLQRGTYTGPKFEIEIPFSRRLRAWRCPGLACVQTHFVRLRTGGADAVDAVGISAGSSI